MDAQYFTDVSFFEEVFSNGCSFVMCLSGPFVFPIDEVLMKPRLMMASLILGA